MKGRDGTVITATVQQRAAAYLLDWVDEPLVAIGTMLWLLDHGAVGTVLAFVWTVWVLSQLRQQALTGQTFGKRVVGIEIVDAITLEPLGGVRTIVRWAARSLDTLLPIRWLRRACDSDVATFADQITHAAAVVPLARHGSRRRGSTTPRTRSRMRSTLPRTSSAPARTEPVRFRATGCPVGQHSVWCATDSC